MSVPAHYLCMLTDDPVGHAACEVGCKAGCECCANGHERLHTQFHPELKRLLVQAGFTLS